MSNSTTEYTVNFQDISNVASDYNTEKQQEFNMDLSFTLTCLQLLNIREDLFQGPISDEFKKLTNTMVNFCKENQVYLDSLVVKEQKERQQADLEEWNPELVNGYVYIPTAHTAEDNYEDKGSEEEEVENQACQESKQQQSEPFNEEEWAIKHAIEWANQIKKNDIYRQKVFVQAESNFHAAEMLSMKRKTKTQSMFYYQQSAELYLKGAMLCKTENLVYCMSVGNLYHQHDLASITEAIQYTSPMTEVAEQLENIARARCDCRTLCIRTRYLSIDAIHTEEVVPPCYVFNDLHLATAKDCVLQIKKYCNAIHDNLKATRKPEKSEQPQKGEEQTYYIGQRIINAFISCFF